MNPRSWKIKTAVVIPILSICTVASAFDSGSTGSDGAFAPLVDTVLTLPADGTFNFTEINIPNGVTITFEKNLTNSPVVWLVQGDALIDGVIDIRGKENGEAGPGGFRGGFGGLANENAATDLAATAGGGGQGPGGGGPGFGASRNFGNFFGSCKGAGGGYGTKGQIVQCGREFFRPIPGKSYGRDEIIPLLGGSGGGGGTGGVLTNGTSGGGGGGAILIAVSGALTINGVVNAAGGASVDSVEGGCGGHGSAGAIRLVASTIVGEGEISAIDSTPFCNGAAGGGVGRIRLEADSLLRITGTTPAYSFDLPQPLFIPEFPQIVISTIGGLTVPANPTGFNDVVLPFNTPNPIDIAFTTNNVPLGAEISLKVSPARGVETTTLSTPIAGTLEAATATASANIPEGTSTLIASVEFVVDAQAGIDYAPYADGQLVARIRTSYEAGKGAITTFITKSGEEYEWPSNAIGIN